MYLLSVEILIAFSISPGVHVVKLPACSKYGSRRKKMVNDIFCFHPPWLHSIVDLKIVTSAPQACASKSAGFVQARYILVTAFVSCVMTQNLSISAVQSVTRTSRWSAIHEQLSGPRPTVFYTATTLLSTIYFNSSANATDQNGMIVLSHCVLCELWTRWMPWEQGELSDSTIKEWSAKRTIVVV